MFNKDLSMPRSRGLQRVGRQSPTSVSERHMFMLLPLTFLMCFFLSTCFLFLPLPIWVTKDLFWQCLAHGWCFVSTDWSFFSLNLLRFWHFESPIVWYFPSDLYVISQTLLGILKANLSFLDSQRGKFLHTVFHFNLGQRIKFVLIQI